MPRMTKPDSNDNLKKRVRAVDDFFLHIKQQKQYHYTAAIVWPIRSPKNIFKSRNGMTKPFSNSQVHQALKIPTANCLS
jgi:hypothetical protein